MAVNLRKHRSGDWEVDFRWSLPDGTRKRTRIKAPGGLSKSGARRWGEARQRELLTRSLDPKQPRLAPTLAEFAPRFLEHARAERQKPSGISDKESRLRVHLLPFLGTKRLDVIGNEDIQKLKARLVDKAPSTVNNVLTVLNKLLKVAVEWDEIDRMPCVIRQVAIPREEARFLEFEEYAGLVDGAMQVSPNAYLVVLLGGEAGLRCGEMMALEWPDVDFRNNRLKISRSEWKGHVTPTKSGRSRVIPLTPRLREALWGHRHIRGSRVLCDRDGRPLTQKMVQGLVKRAERLANLHPGGVHILRHTFCSHMAIKRVSAREIQALAGHADLATTQRYMHLTPQALEDAIRRLAEPIATPVQGAIWEPRVERRQNRA